jgi:hypothetical protein
MALVSGDDNVTSLPVRFKDRGPADRSVIRSCEIPGATIGGGKCTHHPMFGASFIVDEKLSEVECSLCHAKLNPVWAMARIADQDRRFAEARERYVEETKRLSERSRTKCEHCQKMTRISRR